MFLVLSLRALFSDRRYFEQRRNARRFSRRNRPNRLANKVLVILGLICGIQFGFSYQLDRPIGLQLIPAIVMILLVLALFLPTRLRANTALLAASCFGAVLAVEFFLVLVYRPRTATADKDPRSKWEFVQEMRKGGMDIYGISNSIGIPLPPRILDGNPASFLGTISGRTFALCKESGQYIIGSTDQYGFFNPPGLWDRQDIEIVTIGDSFTAGSCVPLNKNYPGRLREHFPLTINIGRPGSSPLHELGALLEYAERLRPKIVIWGYHDNDLYDLTDWKKDKVLSRYLEEGFRQGLIDKQEEIDRVLSNELAFLEEKIGAIRSFTSNNSSRPLWINDLITGSKLTQLAQTIRLDKLNHRIKVEYERLREEPRDFELMREIMKKADRTVKSWNGQLYFLYLPGWALLKFKSIHRDYSDAEKVLSIVGELGIPIIDPRPEMGARQSIDELFFYPHSHYNEDGYQLVANFVVQFLERNPYALRGPTQTHPHP